MRDWLERAGWKVNPARAGMIRHAKTTVKRRTSKPRASGDDPSGPVLLTDVGE